MMSLWEPWRRKTWLTRRSPVLAAERLGRGMKCTAFKKWSTTVQGGGVFFRWRKPGNKIHSDVSPRASWDEGWIKESSGWLRRKLPSSTYRTGSKKGFNVLGHWMTLEVAWVADELEGMTPLQHIWRSSRLSKVHAGLGWDNCVSHTFSTHQVAVATDWNRLWPRGIMQELARQGVWHNILGSRLVAQREIKITQEKCPTGLLGIKPSGTWNRQDFCVPSTPQMAEPIPSPASVSNSARPGPQQGVPNNPHHSSRGWRLKNESFWSDPNSCLSLGPVKTQTLTEA